MVTKSLSDELRYLAGKIVTTKSTIVSEQHTKDAFIVPLVRLLGYDTFNPLEVVPEYTCEFATNKSEKVDYVIIKDRKPLILIEAKDCRVTLGEEQVLQLEKYFNVSQATVGVLTNGVEYWFFTDSYIHGEMDLEPFYKVNMLYLSKEDVAMLELLKKDNLDVVTLRSLAYKSVFRESFKNYMLMQITSPDVDFVNFVKMEIDNKGLPDNEIKETIKSVMKELLNDSVSEKLLVKSKKLAVGTSGRFNIDDCTSDTVTGSKLLYLHIGKARYECTGWKSLITGLIEYEFERGVSSLDLLHRTKRVAYLKLKSADLRSPMKYRDVYFEGNMSAYSLLTKFKELAQELNLDRREIYLEIKSRG